MVDNIEELLHIFGPTHLAESGIWPSAFDFGIKLQSVESTLLPEYVSSLLRLFRCFLCLTLFQ